MDISITVPQILESILLSHEIQNRLSQANGTSRDFKKMGHVQV